MSKEELIKAFDHAVDVYSEYKDDFIDEDFLEALNDSLSFLRGLSAAGKLIARKRFNSFLKGFSHNNNAGDDLEKLYGYMDSEFKSEMLTLSVQKAIQSNSKKAAFIIGVVTHSRVDQNGDYNYQDLTLIKALEDFFDYDIDNLISFIMHLDSVGIDSLSLNTSTHSDWLKKLDVETRKSTFITIQKCISNQIIFSETKMQNLSYDIQKNPQINTLKEKISFTSAGKRLIEIIKPLYPILKD